MQAALRRAQTQKLALLPKQQALRKGFFHEIAIISRKNGQSVAKFPEIRSNHPVALYQSPLIKTLQLLNHEEFETLHFFVASPIFNDARPDETFALFEYLRRYYPAFDAPEVNREVAAKHFFPRAANPVGALQRTMAQLMAIVRKFITFRYAVVRDAYRKDNTLSLHEIQQKLALMRFYSERLHQHPVAAQREGRREKEPENRKSRKKENFFINLNNQVRSELGEQSDFSNFNEYEFIDFQYFKFLVEQEKIMFESTSSLQESDKNLLAATEQLDTFYLLIKLDHLCQMLHYQRMLAMYKPGSPEHHRFQENVFHCLRIVELLRTHGFLQQPDIALYCTFLELITCNDPVETDRLSEAFEALLQQHEKRLPPERVNNLKVMLRSFWPTRYRETKDKRYLEKIHSRQLQQLAQLPPEEKLSTSFFQNTLFSGLKLGKIAWAGAYLDEYAGRLYGLDDTQTELLLEIARTAVVFATADFKKAAAMMPHYLHYGAAEDIYLYAIAATLDTRIHFELGDLEDDYGHAMMHAATTRIRRGDALPPHRREERLRFFSMAKELYKVRETLEINRKAAVQAPLRRVRARLDSETVVDWEWLEEKWLELGGRVI